MTERRRTILDRELLLEDARRAKADAVQANLGKSNFMAVMSHELRTPLNAIGGYADLLLLGIHGPITTAQEQALERIRKGSRHLLGLVNAVLNFARLETGHLDYRLLDVPLNDLLGTCESLLLPQASARGLTMVFTGCETGSVAFADPEKLSQVVLNLLTNAVKFTEAGGVITLSCEAMGDRVLIRVHDTGLGIPADQLSRIFEPFVQVNSQLTRIRDGVGLGLSISRELARGMGGDLTVESETGLGSTFTLTLRASMA